MRSSQVQASGRIPLNVLLGVPDEGRNEVRVAADGKRLFRRSAHGGDAFTLRGGTNIVGYMSTERFLVKLLYAALSP